MAECEHLRVGREFLESVSWPFAFRQEAHDRCYYERCYPPHLKDTMDTRFAISVDEGFFNHHDVWDKWLNCYHGTSIENAKSCVEHRQLLLPNDTTMHGKKPEIREGHIPGQDYVFTTPSISYAALDYYAHTYNFRSPYNLQLHTIKVVLQCKQKPDSIIVQPETVDARRQGIKICRYIPNDKLEWKTQNRSTVTIYGLLLEVKQYHVHDHSNSFQYQQIRNTQNVSYEPATISQTPSPPPFKTKVSTISNSGNISSPTTEKTHREPMSKKRIALLILLVIATILPISALIFGQIYKNDCPIQPWIPRWMTIFGAVGLATFGLLFIIVTLLLIYF
ncbi:unnamed protein product [Adineta steineri]|uniref:Uncharacterized protein n=1 Tax=Adineta steineri TaxID=433720 RepID=A0A814FGM9_9BILA|nr:unnamed protein product [Adineta steineri]